MFIHEDDNPSIRFYDLLGKDVVYTITESSKYNASRGKIKYVVKENADVKDDCNRTKKKMASY